MDNLYVRMYECMYVIYDAYYQGYYYVEVSTQQQLSLPLQPLSPIVLHSTSTASSTHLPTYLVVWLLRHYSREHYS